MNLVLGGVTIKSIKDIESHYSKKDLLEAYSSGLLRDWLYERKEDDARNRLKAESPDDSTADDSKAKEIIEALGLDFNRCQELLRADILKPVCDLTAPLLENGLAEGKVNAKDGESLYRSAARSFRLNNTSDGLVLMAQAANLGCVKAILECGRIFSEGIGVQKDLQSGFHLFEIAAKLEDPEAQHFLGKCYEEGLGCDKNQEQAFVWYERSALAGDNRGQCEYGEMLENKAFKIEEEDPANSKELKKQAIEWYRKSAAKGNAEAMFNLGCVFEDVDDKQAFEWSKRSAEKGYGKAWGELACFYEEGIEGVCQRDVNLACECYRNAAEAGDILSMKFYADFLRQNNRGKEAFDWYQKAADCGSAGALTDLGELYEEGYGVEENLVTAFHLYLQASVAGCGKGSYRLAECFEEGTGCVPNFSIAREKYKLALEQGYQPAQKILMPLPIALGRDISNVRNIVGWRNG